MPFSRHILILVFLCFSCCDSEAQRVASILNLYGNGTGSDSPPSSADTTPDNKQAFLWIGNSIAAGFGAVANTLPTAGTAYEFDRNTSTILNFGSGTPITNFSRNQYSPAAKFCIDYNTNSGMKPVIINRAAGSSYLAPETSNNWQTSGSNYTAAVTAANTCLNQLGLTKLRGILIADILVNDIQGIGTISVVDVGTYFTTFIDNLRADFGTDVPIYIGVPGRGVAMTTSARMTAIRNFIRQAVESYGNVYIGCSETAFAASSLYLPDLIHPNDTGRDYLGAMLARSIKNSGYSKWARAIISCHFHELNSTQKTKIETWLTTWKSVYLQAEYLYVWKGFANGMKANANYDWTFLSGPIADGGFTVSADSHIATNGTNQYFNDGHSQLNSNLFATQNDFLSEIKIKTFPATADKYAFGSGLVYLGQSASNIVYSVSSTTADSYSGETVLSAGSWIVKMNSGTVSLLKDGTQMDTETIASSAFTDFTGFVGAYNNAGVTQNYSNAQFERHVKIKQSAVSNISNFVTALNTLQQ